MAKHITTGQLGEGLAAEYLLGKGYRVLARNVANPHGKRLGELDIVAQKNKGIIFVEVKTLQERTDGDIWLPEWNVSPGKLRKLSRIAEYYMKKEGLSKCPYHFDVIAITLRAEAAPVIKHIEHAFF